MSKQKLEKFLLGLIYALIGVTLIIPLIVHNHFYFPYIFPRAVVFRLAVELLLAAYVFLLYLNRDYRPKKNWLFNVLAGFAGAALISSFFGVNFYVSFWGDIERSEGLILWLHLLAFFLVLVSVIKREKSWFYLFDCSLIVGIVSFLMALGQHFNTGIMTGDDGTRVAAMFGNPSFLAAFMILEMGLAAYLLLKRDNIFLKFYYGALILLFGLIVYFTGTRGAYLGLIFGALAAGLLFLFYKTGNKKIAGLKLALVALAIIGGGVFIVSRDQAWFKNLPLIGRATAFSLEDTTIRNRLTAWNAAWQGWSETPKALFLGYGLENFGVVYDKYFPPSVYEDEGSQLWFDRAHNVIFDRGVTTGFLGLVLYLLFLFLPVYFLFKAYRRGDHGAAALICMIVAFFIQDLFVFETITTYAILIFIWAYLSRFLVKPAETESETGKKLGLPWAAGALVAILAIAYFVNIRPAYANYYLSLAEHSKDNPQEFLTAVGYYQKAISYNTYINQEARIQYIDYVTTQIANAGPVPAALVPIVNSTDLEVDKLVNGNPNYTKGVLLAMRNYNYTQASLGPDKFLERVNRALSYFPVLQKLSPTRPQIYREAGYSEIYLLRYYRDNKDEETANTHADLAEQYLSKSVALNPKVVETNIDLIMFYLNAGETDKILEQLKIMDENNIGYQTINHLNNLMQLSVNNNNLVAIEIFAKKLIELDHSDTNAQINLAVSYAYQGKNDEAIAVANRIKAIGNEYEAQQAELFIEAVKQGAYKQKK